MSSRLHETLSGLGISHLLAISGFHLGVLGFILYWLFYPLYKPFQNRFVPYRHGNRDLFLLVALFLFSYLAFLDFVPSLVRAFGMLIVGYVIYDRGMRVVSMQTLLIAVALLVAIWPRLAFSIGFWLSVGGVFSILLFLLHFSHWKKTWQFAGIHIWVYLMMLPISLHLFGHFTLYHSLSIIWTMLFILFYPLELLLHLAGLAGALDAGMSRLLEFGSVEPVSVEGYTVMAQVILGVAAIRYKKALLLLFGMVLAIFVGAVYQVA